MGLPNVGKSTIFNAITATQNAQAANYPFCTIEPNVGVVSVPDPRLAALAEIVHPQKIVPASIQFVDIAGLVRGASRGEGLGNQFLSHIREVDAIAHVVRCFEDDDVVHVEGRPDPARDVGIIEIELALRDLESVRARRERVQRAAQTGDRAAQAEVAVLDRLAEALDAGRQLRGEAFWREDENATRLVLSELSLLTARCVGSGSIAPVAVFDKDVVGKLGPAEVVARAGKALGQ